MLMTPKAIQEALKDRTNAQVSRETGLSLPTIARMAAGLGVSRTTRKVMTDYLVNGANQIINSEKEGEKNAG